MIVRDALQPEVVELPAMLVCAPLTIRGRAQQRPRLPHLKKPPNHHSSTNNKRRTTGLPTRAIVRDAAAGGGCRIAGVVGMCSPFHPGLHSTAPAVPLPPEAQIRNCPIWASSPALLELAGTSWAEVVLSQRAMSEREARIA